MQVRATQSLTPLDAAATSEVVAVTPSVPVAATVAVAALAGATAAAVTVVTDSPSTFFSRNTPLDVRPLNQTVLG